MDQNTTDLTAALPTMEPSTRSNVKKWTTIGITAAGALLLLDDGVKRFRNKKTVKVTVVDKPSS